MTSQAETAKKIRKAIRVELGATSRQVSVRGTGGSTHSSISIEVKDAAISKAAVQAIAERHQEISRCEITGEILGGGNTFVSVRWSQEVLDSYRVHVLAVLTLGLEDYHEFGSVHVRARGGETFEIYRMDGGGAVSHGYGAHSTANQVAHVLLEAATS